MAKRRAFDGNTKELTFSKYCWLLRYVLAKNVRAVV